MTMTIAHSRTSIICISVYTESAIRSTVFGKEYDADFSDDEEE